MHVLEEFRWFVTACNQQVIPRPGASDVQQVSFGVIDLVEVRVVCDRLDPLL